MLNNQTRFIWYNISLSDSSDSNVDIFDRINATKIELNNAELIKALLLQGDHLVQKHICEIKWQLIGIVLKNGFRIHPFGALFTVHDIRINIKLI